MTCCAAGRRPHPVASSLDVRIEQSVGVRTVYLAAAAFAHHQRFGRFQLVESRDGFARRVRETHHILNSEVREPNGNASLLRRECCLPVEGVGYQRVAHRRARVHGRKPSPGSISGVNKNDSDGWT